MVKCQEVCMRPDLPTGRSILVYGGLIVGAAFLSAYIAKKQTEPVLRLLAERQGYA